MGGIHVQIFLEVPSGLEAIALKVAVMFGLVSIHGRFTAAIRDTMKCDLF